MTELPLELWALISTFLTPAELAVVCGGHRAFFEQLIEIKYRNARMRGVVDDQVFISLANPAVSRRVRSIELDTLNFKTYLLFSPVDFRVRLPGERSGIAPYLRGLAHRLMRRRPGNKDMFPALESLSVDVSSIYKYAPFQRDRHIRRCLRILWRSITKSSLTSLTLNIAIEAYRDGVIPSNLFIPTLRDLKLSIWAGYASTDYKPLLITRLAPLINRHGGSLQRLSIHVEEACFRVHPRYYVFLGLFQHLQYLPNLTTLDIKLPLLTPLRRDLDTLHDFLRKHSRQTTELSIQLSRSLLHEGSLHEPTLVPPFAETHLEGLPLFDGSDLPFPLLKKLDFAVFYSDPDVFAFNLFRKWSQGQPSWKTSLNELCLTSHYFSPQETLSIVPIISPLSGLVSLSLSTRVLQLDFLARLQEVLPRLEKLHLETMHWFQSTEKNRIDGRDGPGSSKEIHDALLSRCRLLATWGLRKLAVCVCAQLRIPGTDDRHKFLVELFPKVGAIEYSDGVA